jgi:hypothetical protein
MHELGPPQGSGLLSQSDDTRALKNVTAADPVGSLGDGADDDPG